MKLSFRLGLNRVTIAAVFLTMIIGTIYRMPSLWNSVASPQKIRESAESQVYEGMKAQLASKIETEHQKSSPEEKKQMLGAQVNQVIQNERAQYESAVESIQKDIEAEESVKKESSQYLLESDPYYYYSLVKRMINEGKISGQFRAGKFFDPMRLAPDGSWDWMTLHPHIGYVVYRVINIFTKMDLMPALGYVSVILSALSVILFYWLCACFEISLFSTFTAGFVFILSAMYIQRSAYGWFDTDPYNFIFPILILILFLKGVKQITRARPYLIGAGILSAFYSYFWMGWPFMVAIICGAFVLLEIASQVFKFETGKWVYIQTGGEYLVAAVVAAAVFMTPSGFLELIKNDLSGLLSFIRIQNDLWPNLFSLLGETKPGTIPKIMFLTGSPVSFGFAVIGMAFGIWDLVKRRNHWEYSRLIPLFIMTGSIFVLAIGAERFALFLIVPLAIFAAFAIDHLINLLPQLLERIKILRPNLIRPVLYCFIFAIIMTGVGILAYAGILNTQPIMNRTWNAAFQEIKEKTPANSIVNSWWDPGYFIIAMANRRSTVDGGTPHFHQSYWIARALATDNEKQSAGILRMLNTSANKALEQLEPKLGTEESVQLISSLVSLDRTQAKKLLRTKLTDAESEELLNLTHGNGNPPPSYVFLYDLLIQMNAAVTLVANWDFGRAKAMKSLEKTGGIGDYFQSAVAISGGILKYHSESPAVGKKGDKIYFANGVTLDLVTHDVQIDLQREKLSGKPLSLFYVENNEFIEKKYEDPAIDVSCLIIQNGEKLSSVLADPRLIRSMLFRLYYLQGKGLHIFKPFIDKSDSGTGTAIKVFEVDWDKLKDQVSVPV